MSKFYKTFSLFLLLILSQYAWAQNDSTNVLFIGNSITYFNNMPQMFRNIANNKGKDVRIASHTPGGTGIVNHYVNPQVYSLIRSRKWDVVILQPGSSESAGASYPVNVTVARAQIILDSIYKNNACTKVYLYEIPYGIPSSGGYPKYFQIQTMIRDSVTKMADALKLQMLPAGESFRAYYSLYQNQLLHGSINDIHPNAFGSYLVASTFYSGIFQDSVSNCTYYSTIPKDTADKFFEIADSVVLKNKSNWRINTYNLHAAFSMMQNIDTISLTNTSSNYQSLLWKFGDGNSSTTSNPTHIYAQNGNYEVKSTIVSRKDGKTKGFKDVVFVIESYSNFTYLYQRSGRIYINNLREYVILDDDYDMSDTPFRYDNTDSLVSGEARYLMRGGKLRIYIENGEASVRVNRY